MSSTTISTVAYKELQSIAIPVHKGKDSTLFCAGQPVKGAFLIRSGRVKMSLEHSVLYPARTIGKGNVIGLPATFSGAPYSLTAKTQCCCRLGFIPRARLLELLRCNPAVGFHIVRVLSEEIFQMRKVARSIPGRAIARAKNRTRARAKKIRVRT